MVAPRGRAAQPIRPGLTIKSVLLGQLPLRTGELVSEAAITDIHSAYKNLTKQENALRPKAKRLRGMTYRSFITLFKFAQLLGLVELVREEPMQYPPPGGDLLSVRKPDGIHVAISVRRVFKLSALGAEDERSWTNLNRAWREGWPAPQKVEVPPVPIPVPVKPPVKPPVVFAVFKWVATPSPRQYRLLLAHLERLDSIGIDNPDVASEIDRLASLIGDWIIAIEDDLEEAKSIQYTEAIHRYEHILGSLTVVSEALGDNDLTKAADALRELVK